LIPVTDLDDRGFILRYRIVKAGDAATAAQGKIVRRCVQPPPRSVEMPRTLRQAPGALVVV